MDKILSFIMVGLGGAVGTMLRYGANLLVASMNLQGTVATFFVNTVGAFLIGLFTGICKDGTMLAVLAVGLCGGFTTFSTFSLQNVKFLQDGKIGLAAVYIVSTLLVCILMTWLGYRLGQSR